MGLTYSNIQLSCHYYLLLYTNIITGNAVTVSFAMKIVGKIFAVVPAHSNRAANPHKPVTLLKYIRHFIVR